MTCCGKTIQKAVGIVSAGIEKTTAIVKGNALLAADRLFVLPRPKYEYADVRLATCRKCKGCTWLAKAEYAEWLKQNGIEILKNLADLTALPPLEKKEYRHKTKLFCRLCKCWLPAKAFVKGENCPLQKWVK